MMEYSSTRNAFIANERRHRKKGTRRTMRFFIPTEIHHPLTKSDSTGFKWDGSRTVSEEELATLQGVDP